MNHLYKYTEIIAKYLAGQTMPDEQDALFAWLEEDPANQQIFDEMVSVWSVTADASSTHFEADVPAAWEKVEAATAAPHVEETIEIRRSAKMVPLSQRVRRWSLAAAVLVALGLGLWWFSQTPDAPQFVEIQTVAKQKQEVVLPDSSHVWLNENSSLTYDPRFEKRQVSLEGEAFFEVEHLAEKPFEITSGGATTTVLGTSFNVRAYPKEDKIEVTVKTGKVAFAALKSEKKPVILPAGSVGVFYKKEEKVEAVEEKTTNADAWKTGKLDFTGMPLGEIAQVLERYFDVKISIENEAIRNCTYAVTFDQQSMEEIMPVLAASLDFQFEETTDGYNITGGGCHLTD